MANKRVPLFGGWFGAWIPWLDVVRALSRLVDGLVDDLARNLLPSTITWGKPAFHCGSDDCFVLRADFVLCVVVSSRCEPTVLLPCSAGDQLGSHVGLVRKHLVVPTVRGEAATVVLVQDLNLEPLLLKPGKQVLARVVACLECRPPWLQLWVGVRVRRAVLLVVFLVVASSILPWDFAVGISHRAGHAACYRERSGDPLVDGRRKGCRPTPTTQAGHVDFAVPVGKRVVGGQDHRLEEIPQWKVAFILPLLEPPMIGVDLGCC